MGDFTSKVILGNELARFNRYDSNQWLADVSQKHEDAHVHRCIKTEVLTGHMLYNLNVGFVVVFHDGVTYATLSDVSCVVFVEHLLPTHVRSIDRSPEAT